MLAIVLASLTLASSSHARSQPTSNTFSRGGRDETTETWRAPDDERGFGEGRTRREIERWVRAAQSNSVSAARDRALLTNLQGLASDVEIELARTAARCNDTGQYALLGEHTTHTPEGLATRFHELAADARRTLTTVGEHVDPLARLLSDVRFRARARVLDGVAFELSELRGALALFGAQADGWVDLTDAEIERVARRADLAAARLRAIRSDLRALAESSATAGANAPWQRDYELLLVGAHGGEHGAQLDEALARLSKAEDKLCANLFTTRLSETCADALFDRVEEHERASEYLAQIRELAPELFGAEPEHGTLAQAQRTEHKQRAARLALQILELDPLGESSNWIVATTTDASRGRSEALRYYDRFLALRGIRVQEARTHQDRVLTPEERTALEAVRELATRPQPGA